MSELKPCPFCGDTDVAVEQPGASRQSCIVVCTNCGVRLESNETGWGKWWNTRVGDAWISVDERLPDSGTDVLACGLRQEIMIGCVLHDSKGYYAENENDELDYVTHWMPLPDPPKEAT